MQYYSCQFRRISGSSRLAWSKGQRPPSAVLNSSNEPGELSQWQGYDYSTINIVVAQDLKWLRNGGGVIPSPPLPYLSLLFPYK